MPDLMAHMAAFYHGTNAELEPGDHVVRTPRGYELASGRYNFYTDDPGHAHYHAVAKSRTWGGQPHVYQVEPTGLSEPDPDDVTGLGRPYRSTSPLRVVRKLSLLAHFGATDWDQFYDKIPGEIHRGLYAPESHGVFAAPASDEDVAHMLIRAYQEEQFPYDRDQHEKFGTHWTTDEGVARGFAQEHFDTHHDEFEGEDHDHAEHSEAVPVVFHAARPDRRDIEHDERRLGWQNVDDYRAHEGEREVPIRHGAPVRIKGVSWLKHTGLGPMWHRHDLREPVELRVEDRDSPSDPNQWNASLRRQAAAGDPTFPNAYHGTRLFGGRLDWAGTWFHGTRGAPEFTGRRGHAQDELSKPPEERQMHGGWAQPNQLLGVHFSPLHEVAHKFAGSVSSTPSAVVHARLHFQDPAHFPTEHHLNIAMADWGSKHYPHWHNDKLNSSMAWNYSDTEGTHRDFSRAPDNPRQLRALGNAAQSLLQWHPHMPEILQGFTRDLREHGHRGITYGNGLEGPYETDAGRGGEAAMKYITKRKDWPEQHPYSISAIAQPEDIQTVHVEHISPWREEPKAHERTWEDVSDGDEGDAMRDRILDYHREHGGEYPRDPRAPRTAAYQGRFEPGDEDEWMRDPGDEEGPFYHGSPHDISGHVTGDGFSVYFTPRKDYAWDYATMGGKRPGWIYHVRPTGRYHIDDPGIRATYDPLEITDREEAGPQRPHRTAALEARDYKGTPGDNSHITRNEYGLIPTSAIAAMPGVRGEVPGEHRNMDDEDEWPQFKEDIARNGIQHPVFITVNHGEEPRLSEGNHRRDAAVELGISHVPAEIRYFGHAEQQGTVLERHQHRQACLTCGCDEPHNRHGDERNITIEDLEGAADWADISVGQAVKNLDHAVQHEKGRKHSAARQMPVTETGPLYHGTTAERAQAILDGGFRGNLIHLTPDPELARSYAEGRVQADGGGTPAVLRIGTVRGVSAAETAYGSPDLNRQAGAHYMDKGPEVLVLDPAAMHGITRHAASGKHGAHDALAAYVPKRHVSLNDAARLVEQTKKNGGMSVDPGTGREPRHGYMVGQQGTGHIVDAVEFYSVRGTRLVRDYLAGHHVQLSHPRAHLGTWHDRESGKVFLDISRNHRNLEEATLDGKKNDQIAIWDLDNGGEIPTGGTGGLEKEAAAGCALCGLEQTPVSATVRYFRSRLANGSMNHYAGGRGDRHVRCEQGHLHWGAYGAAGLLIRHRGQDGQMRYLLQKRSPYVNEPDTWSTPGGALHYGESPERGAMREAREELGPLPRSLKHHHTDVTTDHGDWKYHTVVMDAPEHFNTRGGGETDFETAGSGWHTADEIKEMGDRGDLHPAFAESWPRVHKTAIDWHKPMRPICGTCGHYKDAHPSFDRLYHGTSPANRHSIRDTGLGVEYEQGYGSTEPGVYMSPRPDEHNTDQDIWEVDTRGLHVHPDDTGNMYEFRDVGGSYFSAEDIPPERLKLHYKGRGNKWTGFPPKEAVVTPGSLPPEQQAAFDVEDLRAHRNQIAQVGKNPPPGTRVWRGERRRTDEEPETIESTGMHWSANPDAIITGWAHPGEKHVVWQGVIEDHEKQAFPRSHPIWSGKHMSFDWEAETRFRPGAHVKVEGAYVHTPEEYEGGVAGSPGYLVPNHPERTNPGWKWHPLDRHIRIRHGGYGASDYSDLGIERESSARAG